MKKIIVLVSALLVLVAGISLLSACGGEDDPIITERPTTRPIEHTLTAPESTVASGNLIIGQDGKEKTVPYTSGDGSAASILSILAEETGWNLDTAEIKYTAADTVAISFKSDASIFNSVPADQKADYKETNAKKYVTQILNSVAKTLVQNQCGSNVYFVSESGGDLKFENGGAQFSISASSPYYTVLEPQTQG
ncbi:MAG: hypothetical protein LBB67_03045 [Oscillospiraceae bacterium]|nr:hypothetical protein [Oscillospiraceae bacterium]